MPAEKTPRLRTATVIEENIIKSFCNSIGAEKWVCYSKLLLLEIPGGTYYDVFDPPARVERFLEEVLSYRAYAIGMYLGILDVKRRQFKPSLVLAHRLAPYCKEVSCCVLDSRGERFFLYNKPVREDHIIKCADPGRGGIRLVVNHRGEALGWGIVASDKSIKRRSKPILKPVIDLGWYLRRGG
jgi:ribosome biogenesis protein Nip4